jgi:hypothetical protein
VAAAEQERPGEPDTHADEPTSERPNDRQLAFTGFEASRGLLAGAALLMAGAIVTFIERRRRHRPTQAA